MAYQFENIKDPLINTSKCQLDAGLIKDLGANTIRVYAVDGTQSHDGCMQAFASQGIYVWLDLPSPYMAFNRVRRTNQLGGGDYPPICSYCC